jgi:hypothetical protein
VDTHQASWSGVRLPGVHKGLPDGSELPPAAGGSQMANRPSR